MIDRPLPSLNAWLRALVDADLPVLPSSAQELQDLQVIEDTKGTVDAHMLVQHLSGDPLIMLKVLVHVSRYCTRLSVEPPETMTGAIVMQGITPFFQAFSSVTTTEQWFGNDLQGLEGLNTVIRRARRAAHFAMSFALHRQDEDAGIIHDVALLHSFPDMLLWCHAPRLAQEISGRLAADHTLRSAAIQKEVLGIALSDLGPALMRAWQLPNLLIRCTDDRHALHPQVRTVMLAVRLARHTQYGWDNPHALAALPDDIADIAQLLTLSNEVTARKIRDLDE